MKKGHARPVGFCVSQSVQRGYRETIGITCTSTLSGGRERKGEGGEGGGRRGRGKEERKGEGGRGRGREERGREEVKMVQLPLNTAQVSYTIDDVASDECHMKYFP